MSYQPGIYRKQAGNELVVASTTSGPNQGVVTLEAASGGIRYPVQTLGTSQTATTVNGFGLTTLTASTTAPTYTIGAPAAAGLLKGIALSAATSAASSVVLQGATTAVQIGVSGDNQITLTSTGASVGVLLWSVSTSNWAVVGGAGTVISAAQST